MGKTAIVKRCESIEKPATDTRQYRGLELENGIRVVLVSDPMTDKSSAAMDVNVGSMMDPDNLNGLAHFCEHMLFMGTKKYPSENEYSKYLAENAGMYNAYTSMDHTNYHFDIKADCLAGILNRFVQFFISPLFTESGTEREILAVHSEFSNYFKNDTWRIWEVAHFIADPTHDFRKFSVGNTKTLMDDPKKLNINTRDALLEFHTKWYSSNMYVIIPVYDENILKMSLCILGKESLDELERYVEEMDFRCIENKNVERVVWSKSPYGPEQLKRRVEIVPVQDKRAVHLIFPFPDTSSDYESKSHEYLAHLIGHESSGSILSELKKRGWATSLAASYSRYGRGFGFFDISIDLSIDGLGHIDDVIELTFNYTRMVEVNGPQKWIFDELSAMGEISFRFKDKQEPYHTTMKIAKDLQYIPTADILSHNNLYKKYEPEKITALLALFNPSNMVYKVISQSFAGQQGNIIEPIYGTEIRISNIPSETIEKFNEARKKENPVFRLPDKNDFIASKFDLKTGEAEKSEYPRLIMNNEWCRVWFKQDGEYKMPKQETKLVLTNPVISQDAKMAVISQIWLKCFKDKIKEDIYQAELAHLYCYFNIGPLNLQLPLYRRNDVLDSCFTIKISGYDEKQAHLLKFLIKKLTSFKIDRTRFDVVLDSIKRKMSDFSKAQPIALAMHYERMMLSDKYWDNNELLRICKETTLDEVQNFTNELLKAFHLEILIHGNSTEQEVLTLTNDILGLLKDATSCRPLAVDEFKPRYEIALKNGYECVFRKEQNVHDSSCVQTAFQIGTQNTNDNAFTRFMDFVMREPAFDMLRTKEALGYIVKVEYERSPDVILLNILVQGNKNADHVHGRIEAFLEVFREEVVKMSDEEFGKHVTGMIAELKKKPKNLQNRYLRFWYEIEERQYDFGRREKEAEVIKNMKKSDFIAFFDKKIRKGGPERRKLTIMIHGKNEDRGKIEEIIKNKPAGCQEIEMSTTDHLKKLFQAYDRPTPAIDVKLK